MHNKIRYLMEYNHALNDNQYFAVFCPKGCIAKTFSLNVSHRSIFFLLYIYISSEKSITVTILFLCVQCLFTGRLYIFVQLCINETNLRFFRGMTLCQNGLQYRYYTL